VTNALAYLACSSVTNEKSFKTLTNGNIADDCSKTLKSSWARTHQVAAAALAGEVFKKIITIRLSAIVYLNYKTNLMYCHKRF
jgi:hypothetical protein